MTQIVSFMLGIIMFLFPTVNVSKITVDKKKWNTDYDYVYCHGLSGWGSYDIQNNIMPYWGMFGGDMIKNLNALGYKCHAASVAPFNAPSAPLDRENIEPGIWYVRETYRGDHMAFCGDLFKPHNIRPFFADWMNMINEI